MMRKRTIKWAVITSLVGLMLFLAGCGGGMLSIEVSEDGRSADITAENAQDGDFVTSGSLIFVEGESLAAEYVFDGDGGMDIRLIPVKEGDMDASAEELEALADEGEAALNVSLSGSGTTEYDIAPGDYYVSVVAKGKTSGSANLSVQAAPAEEDGQNPVMNFVGPYVCDRAMIKIDAKGKNKAKVTVTWGGSAWEKTEWTMSGPFDEATRTIEYHNCVKEEVAYKDDGTVAAKQEIFTGGHGFLKFGKKGNKLTWQEDQEHVADGMIFKFDADAEAK